MGKQRHASAGERLSQRMFFQQAVNAEFHKLSEVQGKTAILLDDMVDTAGTLTEDAKALKRFGAKHVFAACSHGVLSGPAIKRLHDSPIEELMISNSIPLNGKATGKVTVLSVASLLAEAIKRIHEDKSVSQLFV